MSEVLAGQTHYMSFPHPTTGLTREGFTFTLLADGEVRQDISVECREVKPNYYVAWFVNDGEHNVNWVLFAKQPAVDITYMESWQVKKNIVERQLSQIRSKMEGEGGYIANVTIEEE